MTWGEFQDLPLSQLEALEERRTIRVRHDRFNAGLVAAVLINCNRVSSESEPLSPFDFIPGYETSDEELERRKLRRSTVHAIRVALVGMRGIGPEAVAREKAAMIQNMLAAGVEDPESLMQEAFPEE